RTWIDANTCTFLNSTRQKLLVGQSLRSEACAEIRLFSEGLQLEQQSLRGIEQAITQVFDQQARQLGVGLIQPAAKGNAVGLVADALRIQRMQIGKDRLTHQPGMQCRNPVYAVRPEKRQVAH